eukprot:5747083-Alexandrium_andersonii.AAC.1
MALYMLCLASVRMGALAPESQGQDAQHWVMTSAGMRGIGNNTGVIQDQAHLQRKRARVGRTACDM